MHVRQLLDLPACAAAMTHNELRSFLSADKNAAEACRKIMQLMQPPENRPVHNVRHTIIAAAMVWQSTAHCSVKNMR